MKLWINTSSHQKDYGYLNARLRGRWGAFYAPSFFDSMSDEDLYGLEQAMLKGPYASHYRRELVTAKSSILERIERATTSGASERLRSVFEFSTGEARELIPVLSIRGDMFNTRILLRRFTEKDNRSGQPQWHDYGPLGSFFFESLWRECVSPMEAIERCYTSNEPTAIPLAHSLEAFIESSDFMIAERCYMSEIISWSLRPLNGLSPGEDKVREFVGRSVDLWNIQIWFRKSLSRNKDIGKNWDYLDGGTITSENLNRSSSLTDLLSDTIWSDSLKLSSQSFPELGRKLQIDFLKWQIGLFRLDILGIGVAIAYMARQILEWRNMEILAVGLSANLAPDRIRNLIWRL